jgi:sulfofructose kinase
VGIGVSEPSLAVIGLATSDLILRVDWPIERGGRHVAREGLRAGGGVAATAAVASARLGVRTAFIGQVGDDRSGRDLAAELEREGVETQALRIVPGARSPASAVIVDEGGERTIIHDPGDLPPLRLDAGMLALCRAATWIHLDGLGYGALAQLRAAGIVTPVSLDAGNPIADLRLEAIACYAPTRRALERRYPGVAVDEAAQRALGEGAGRVIVTLGAAGSEGFERVEGEIMRVTAAAPAVETVSTLGAGDVFHGALVAAFARGLALAEALQLANATAALSTRALDARSAIPDWAEAAALAEGGGTTRQVLSFGETL